VEKISPARQDNLAASADRTFEFNKRAELLVGAHNKALAVVPSKRG
jgi:hypothetical protein